MASWNGNVLAFGGTDGNYVYDDTWVWNGSTWTQHHPAHAPEPRQQAGAVSFNGNVLLFGGTGSAYDYGDTWQWDGRDWTRVAVTGPSQRDQVAMATLGGIALLYGGHDPNIGDYPAYEDTWLWDGMSWTAWSTTTIPGAVYGASIGSLGGQIILTNGLGMTCCLTETFLWNGSAWSRSSTTTMPGSLFLTSSATLGNHLFQFGGLDQNSTPTSTTWQWDGSNWTQLPATGPTARYGAAMAAP